MSKGLNIKELEARVDAFLDALTVEDVLRWQWADQMRQKFTAFVEGESMSLPAIQPASEEARRFIDLHHTAFREHVPKAECEEAQLAEAA